MVDASRATEAFHCERPLELQGPLVFWCQGFLQMGGGRTVDLPKVSQGDVSPKVLGLE